MRRGLSSRLHAAITRLRGLRADEGGNVIVYVSLTAALLMGVVGLALDGSRFMITHSEAQAAADAAALAGASQLDMQSGACNRGKAEAAAVVNNQRFATSGPAQVTIAAGSPVCLNNLPPSDSTAIPGSMVTTSDTAAAYIQVTTQQLTHQNTLLDAVSSNGTATVQRTAVAGFRRSLCAAAPVMMTCDSLTWTTGVAYDAWIAIAQNKGWVSNCGSSAPCVQTTLASEQPSFCIKDDSIQPVGGNKTQKAQDGINERFGQGSTSTERSDTNIMSYPHDITAGALGWDCKTYWTTNHPGETAPSGCSMTGPTTTLTRYAVYQLERANNDIPAAGRPSTPNTTTAERRLAYIAIFDCNGGTVPEGFLKTFMLEPATGKNQKTQYVEVLGLATSKTDPTAVHEDVQLYR
jgi:Flp pilus assembly protein TadG